MYFAGGERMQRFFASLRMAKLRRGDGNYFTVTVSNCAPLTT
jgi:hypothetical protein